MTDTRLVQLVLGLDTELDPTDPAIVHATDEQWDEALRRLDADVQDRRRDLADLRHQLEQREREVIVMCNTIERERHR
jgi:hypothetical protein